MDPLTCFTGEGSAGCVYPTPVGDQRYVVCPLHWRATSSATRAIGEALPKGCPSKALS